LLFQLALFPQPYSGIGLESSILFALEGANVLLVDVNFENAQKAAKIVSERSPNVKAIPFKADVSKEAEVKASVDKALEEFGRLDIMVGLPPSCSQSQLILPVQQRRYHALRG
jgi:enoyl-[acyl-carrier-protein] reductase (NADH)